jgi:hypothetical protein
MKQCIKCEIQEINKLKKMEYIRDYFFRRNKTGNFLSNIKSLSNIICKMIPKDQEELLFDVEHCLKFSYPIEEWNKTNLEVSDIIIDTFYDFCKSVTDGIME